MVTSNNCEAIEISDSFRWKTLSLRRFEVCIVDSFNMLRTEGIEPILIKGWAANRFYPDDNPRSFSDIDIAVSSKEFNKAINVIGKLPRQVNIDLHNEFRHLDTVSWSEMFERSELVPIDDITVRILSPEDHLRILCCHWLNDGGQYKDRLWDIYYSVANRPVDFDWTICLDSVSSIRRQWIIVTILATHKYLGLDISGLPFVDSHDELPRWMQRCLEREWRSDVRLLPLQTVLKDPKKFWIQIRKRIPPNPIQATVETEGKFDESPRFKYQLLDILKRTVPSAKRLVPAIVDRLKK